MAQIMKETFPLRLICIEETLASDGGVCFSPCTDWKFHIISHTWTKDVRNWSLDICNMLHSTPHDDDHLHDHKRPRFVDRYAALFPHHNFATKTGHREFVEFLRILKADGVEKVWFDALCINQGDDEEKNREIAHMGAYYAQSEGCYVWCHGVGGGFQLWAPAPSPEFYKLPRWFSRVWTLQELVLPKKLAFVVGMDMEGFTGYFSYMAFCRSTRLTWHPKEHMSDSAKAKFGPMYEYSLHLLNSKKLFPCPHCANQDRSNDTVNFGHVYYVERSNYFELMEKSSYKSLANHRLPATFWPYLKFALQRLPSMVQWQCEIGDCEGVDLQNPADIGREGGFEQLQAYGGKEMAKYDSGNSERCRRLQLAALAVREISLRNCSEGNDEDRLLSILALLEIEGKVQLRTRKSLEQQTLDVVKGLLNSNHRHAFPYPTPSMKDKNSQDIIALLCLAQFRGNPAILMSWAPTFTHYTIMGDMNFQKISAYMFNSFRTLAHIHELSSLGLKLQCPFLRAKVIPFAHHQHRCGTCDICRCYTRMIHNRMKHFVLEVQERQHYSVFMWVNHDDTDHEDANELQFTTACPPTCSMIIKAETRINKLLSMTLNVWLLLLAEDRLQGGSDSYGLFLVCVGQDMANLHKVGVLFDGPGWDPERDEEDLSDAASSSLSASSEGDKETKDLIENEEIDLGQSSNKDAFEAWKKEENYMQEFASEDDLEEEDEEEQIEEDILSTGVQEAETEQELMASPRPDEELECMSAQEEEEMTDKPTWEQDLQSMQRGHFTISGFGPFVPLHLFTFQDSAN